MDKAYRQTLNYYENFSNDYAARAASREETQSLYDTVLPLLKPGAKILDLGCGPGIDSLFFLDQGFDVTSVDGSESMCDIAKQNGVKNIRKESFLDLHDKEKFDLVWANKAMLHVKISDLPRMFTLVHNALKSGGLFFLSFKYGNSEGLANDGRWFSDFDEEKFHALLKISGNFDIKKDVWVYDDIRKKQIKPKLMSAILVKKEK